VKTLVRSARRDPSEARAILFPHDAGCFQRIRASVTRTDANFVVRHEVTPMPSSWWLLSAAVLVSCNGCMRAPVEHTVRKVTTEDVRRDTEKAVDTATRAAAQAKEDFETRLKAGLAEMEEKIERLREKGDALKDEAKTRWREKMADLEAKQRVARDKLEEVRESTTEAWGHVEKGAQAAWENVRKALQEAAEEF
jgi:hypothetical protein